MVNEEFIVIFPSAAGLIVIFDPATNFLYVPPVRCPLDAVKLSIKVISVSVVSVPAVGVENVNVGCVHVIVLAEEPLYVVPESNDKPVPIVSAFATEPDDPVILLSVYANVFGIPQDAAA